MIILRISLYLMTNLVLYGYKLNYIRYRDKPRIPFNVIPKYSFDILSNTINKQSNTIQIDIINNMSKFSSAITDTYTIIIIDLSVRITNDIVLHKIPGWEIFSSKLKQNNQVILSFLLSIL